MKQRINYGYMTNKYRKEIKDFVKQQEKAIYFVEKRVDCLRIEIKQLKDEIKVKEGALRNYQKLSQKFKNKATFFLKKESLRIKNHADFRGPNNPAWRGGRQIDSYGYVRIYKPNHPRASKKGYVLEHILVMEKKIGRLLTSKEIIHHINGVKSDNRIKNLELFPSHSIHTKAHAKLRPSKKKFFCINCGKQISRYAIRCRNCFLKQVKLRKNGAKR